MEKSQKYSTKGSVQPVPDGFSTVTPFLVADQADKLIEFMKKAFAAKTKFISYDDQDRIMHATVEIGNSIIMVADTMDNNPHATCQLYLYLEDVDKTYQEALHAGAASIRKPLTEFYGDRSAAVRDEVGDVWWVATHVEDVAPEELRKRTEKALRERRQTADAE